jgi:ribonucleoside-diphosphate reductase alpha chain
MSNLPKRPKVTTGYTHKVKVGCGNLYITVNYHENQMYEVFANIGKSGGCAISQAEATTRAITVGLRSGVSPDIFIDQLRGIRCPSPLLDGDDEMLSCADAIAKVMEKELEREVNIDVCNK